MEVFRTIAEFRTWRRKVLLQGLSIGLVPTMGALHAGHISLGTNSLSPQFTIQAIRLQSTHPQLLILLVEHARNENDIVVISLFVNPAQFAPTEDFDAYPRTWETDKAMIQALNLKSVAVFMPTNSEMYPRGISLDVKNQKGAFVEVLGLSEQVPLLPASC